MGLLATVLIAGPLLSCSKGAPTAPPVFAGTVYDAKTHAPVPNTRVSIAGTQVSAVTDAHGVFNLTYPGANGHATPLVVQNPNYGRVTKLAELPSFNGEPLAIFLRGHDVMATVALPAAGGAPTVVPLPNAIGTASVGFPAGSLTLPNGTVAQGNIRVAASYWSADDDHGTAPAMLYSTEADGTFAQLLTYGMIDVQAYQGDTALRVTPGQYIILTMPLSAGQQARLSTGGADLPNAYSVDDSSGLWRWEAAASTEDPLTQKSADRGQNRSLAAVPLGAGVVVKVKTNGTIAVYPTALNGWNVDTGLIAATGGCLTGTVVDACTNAPLPNAAFKFWFLGYEEIAQFKGSSDASGHFCLPTPYQTYGSQVTTNQAAINYLVTGASPQDTAQCNPAAKYPSCFHQQVIYQPMTLKPVVEQLSYVSPCKLGIPLPNGTPVPGDLHYQDSCTPKTPLLLLTPCNFCNAQTAPPVCVGFQNIAVKHGDSFCTPVPNVKIPGPNCKCSNGVCAPPCVVKHALGDPCYVNPDPKDTAHQLTTACCNPDPTAPPLRCCDDVCVLQQNCNTPPAPH